MGIRQGGKASPAGPAASRDGGGGGRRRRRSLRLVPASEHHPPSSPKGGRAAPGTGRLAGGRRGVRFIGGRGELRVREIPRGEERAYMVTELFTGRGDRPYGKKRSKAAAIGGPDSGSPSVTIVIWAHSLREICGGFTSFSFLYLPIWSQPFSF